jgi:hypothetical protein
MLVLGRGRDGCAATSRRKPSAGGTQDAAAHQPHNHQTHARRRLQICRCEIRRETPEKQPAHDVDRGDDGPSDIRLNSSNPSRWARTLADLDDAEDVGPGQVAEAIQYRVLDRGST